MAPTVVQQQQNNSVNDYGLDNIPFSNTAGNALLAFVGWSTDSGVQSSITMPAVNISDSAGNLWRQIGITPASESGSRCAVWMCPNSQALNIAGGMGWVSVATTGWSNGVAYNIVEISGMPQAVQMDFSFPNSSHSASSLSWTGTTTTADIAFLVVNVAGSTHNVSSTPTGWTALTASSTVGQDGIGSHVYSYWRSSVAASTSLSGSASLSATTCVSAVVCTISSAAQPPAQPTPWFPKTIVEAAFGASPGDPTQSVDYTWCVENVVWTDITNRCIGDSSSSNISVTRGRQYELGQQEAGELDFNLDNHDGAFNPGNTSSPYYSNALNSNMSFQYTTTPWTTANGASIALSSVQFYSGSFSCLLTPNGSTANPEMLSEVVAGINQNYSYTANAQIYFPNTFSGGMRFLITWYNSSAGVISTSTGSTQTITAGTWNAISTTFAAVSGAVGAQIIIQMVGTPTTSQTMFVDEAALVWGSSPVQTGLIRLNTPVRVTAWWEGIQYPIGFGYVERWPQDWPDMPQWGFSKMVAVDAFGAMSSCQMPSCVQGEVLEDNPYAYFPLNEQYSTAVNGATGAVPFYFGSAYYVPVDSNGLIAINYAPGNNRTGTYNDGLSAAINTGLAINLLGDENTGMGAQAYSAQASNEHGPGMTYVDSGLPNGAGQGACYEFWFLYPSENTAFNCNLLATYGIASAYAFTGGVNGLIFFVYLSTAVFNGANYTNVNFVGNNMETAAITFILDQDDPVHIVMNILPTTGGAVNSQVNLYINSEAWAFIDITAPVTMKAVNAGPSRYSYDGADFDSSFTYQAYNYTIAHLAVYDYQLSTSRIFDHYQAGLFGWAGVTPGYRIAQIMTWGGIGLKRAGVVWQGAAGSEVTQISEAYQLSGQSVSDAVSAVTQSEGGIIFTTGNGSVTYLQRWARYNEPSSFTFGDNASATNGPLNMQSIFTSNFNADWTGTNSTLSVSTVKTYSAAFSLLMTPNGSSTIVSATSGKFLVYANNSYQGFAWLNSTSGSSNLTLGIAWYNSSGSLLSTSTSSTFSSTAGIWQAYQFTATAPTGATQGTLIISEGGTPAGTATVYVSYAAAYEQSVEIPYLATMGADFDNTNLYNEVTAIQNRGPNELLQVDNRDQTSTNQYFRRSALNFTSNVVSNYDVYDVVNWNLQQVKQPTVRIAEMEIHPSTNPYVVFTAALSTDIADIVTVNRRPLGGGVISELGIVEQVKHEIGPTFWKTSFQVSPYTLGSQVLVADVSGQDVLGTQALPW